LSELFRAQDFDPLPDFWNKRFNWPDHGNDRVRLNRGGSQDADAVSRLPEDAQLDAQRRLDR
jgi:hypothetical protein